MKKVLSVAFLMFLCWTSVVWASGDTFIVGNQSDARTLDPIGTDDIPSSTVMFLVYDTLVKYDDEKDTVVPWLAESFEQTAPLSYKFVLREGVKFHNGEPLTAADVKYSLDRAKEQGAAVVLYTSVLDRVEVVDNKTVIMHLKEPYTPFLTTLSMAWACILNRKAVEEKGETYGTQPVGTGVLKFISWRKGDQIDFEVFQDYWGKKPSFKKVIYRIIVEENSRALEVESGALDAMWNISFLDGERLKDHSDIDVYSKGDYSLHFIGFNYKHPPLDNPLVRRALVLAADVEAMRLVGYNNSGTFPVSSVNPGMKYAQVDKKPQHHDLEEAKKLLKEAGVQPGLKFKLWTNNDKSRVDVATIFQSNVRELGLDLEISTMEFGAYQQALKEGTHDICIYSYVVGSPDPHFALFRQFHSSLLGQSNRWYVEDATIDSLLTKACQLPDGPERQAIYFALQDKIDEYSPWIYVQNTERFVAAQKYVKGIKQNRWNTIDLYDITLEK